jgi:outer membrane autotransporter protein
LNDITFAAGSKIELAPVASDPGYWLDNNVTLFTVDSGTTLDLANVSLGLYKLEDQTGGNYGVASTLNKAEDAIKGSTTLTPNIVAGAVVVDDIIAKGLAVGATAAQQAAFLGVLNAVNKIDAASASLTPAQTQEAYKQLFGESLVNVTASVSATVLKTQTVVFNRLDRVREIEISNLTPPAAGSGDELNRVWVGGFGLWAKEDDSSVVSGYDYAGGGFALGFDREVGAVPGLRFGISGAYANGRLKNNDQRTSVDMSTLGIGVYGSYLLPNNAFFDANVAYASTRNEYTTNLIAGGVKTGTFHVNSWMFGVRGGYVFKGDSYQIIPSIGVKYVFLRQGAFADTLDAVAQGNTLANAYRSRTDHQVDIPVQIKFNTTVHAGSATLTPELRLGYNFAVDKLDNAMRVGFVGSPQTFEITGTRSRGNSFQAGVGLKVNTGGVVDAFVNYDLDASKDYISHSASLGLGFEF